MQSQNGLLVGAIVAGAALGAFAAWRQSTARTTRPVVEANRDTELRVPKLHPNPADMSAALRGSVPPQRSPMAQAQATRGDATLPREMNAPAASAPVAALVTRGGAPSDAAVEQTPRPIVPTDAARATLAPDSPVAERAFGIIESLPARSPQILESGCVAGQATDCLSLAEQLAPHVTNRQQAATVRAYRERAYSIYVPQCHHRNPDACVAIARMHARGLGLPKQPANVEALIARARELCRHHPGLTCAAFDR